MLSSLMTGLHLSATSLPLQTRTSRPSYLKTHMIHQSRHFWTVLGRFCFAINQRQIGILLTSQQIQAVVCLLDCGAEAAAKLKASINKDVDSHVSRKKGIELKAPDLFLLLFGFGYWPELGIQQFADCYYWS